MNEEKSGKNGNADEKTKAGVEWEGTITAIRVAFVHNTDHRWILDGIRRAGRSFIGTSTNGTLHRLNGLLLFTAERCFTLLSGAFNIIFLDTFRELWNVRHRSRWKCVTIFIGISVALPTMKSGYGARTEDNNGWDEGKANDWKLFTVHD